jgi:hypothetical protein
MLRTIFLLLLAAASGNATAEWNKVTELEAGSLYVEPASIQRNGDVVKMRSLYDLNSAIVSKANGKPYASQNLQGEYDCRKAQWRPLDFSWHSERMGEGKMVEHLSDTFRWEPIPAGTGVEMLWKLACGGR